MEGNPEIYYQAGRRCHELADDIDTLFTSTHGLLSRCDRAAGLDPSGRDWAKKYDPWVQDIYYTIFESLLPALEKYSQILIQVGFNHAMADYNATSSSKSARPEKPTPAESDRGHLDYRSLNTSNGTGIGLTDNIGLANDIGHYVPDGDTDELQDTADAWSGPKNRTDLGTAAKLVGPIVDFEHLDAADAPGIVEDLRDLTQATHDIFASCDRIHQFVQDQYTNLYDLRSRRLTNSLLETAARQLVSVDVAVLSTAVDARFSTTVISPLVKSAFSTTMIEEVEEWRRDRDGQYAKVTPTDLGTARRIADEIRERSEQDLGGSKSGEITFGDPKRPHLGSDGKYYVKEGDTEVQIDDPRDLSRTITDIDKVQNGVLWEEKSATTAIDPAKWVEKQVTKKMESYLDARQYIEDYERAPIGIEFTTPGVDPAFKAEVEKAVSDLQAKHPDVEIMLKWPT